MPQCLSYHLSFPNSFLSFNFQEELVENDVNVTEIVRSLESFTDIQNLVNSLPTLAVIFEVIYFPFFLSECHN